MSKLAEVFSTAAIWPHLIAAIQSGRGPDETDRQLQLTLAHLAWTCRSAYSAIQPHLWSTLRLVFRDRGTDLPLPSTKDTTAATKELLDRHAQVMDSSLFPHYNKSTTSATTAGCHNSREKVKIQRIRAVSEFRYLYPFVVLGGKLYLASVRDKRESNGTVPVTDSLWGQQGKKMHSLESRVVGGLFLVEYPLHLVTRLVLDFCDPSMARRFECSPFFSKTDFTAKLPFLLSPQLCDQVTSFTLLAANPGHCLGTLHRKLSHAYSAVQCHDWVVRRGGLRPAPEVPPTAHHVRIFNDHAFNAAHPLRAVADAATGSRVTHFEQHGAGIFHFCWVRSQPFASTALTTLVLDFDVDFAVNRQTVAESHVSYRFSMPALRHFAISTSVADLLFPRDSPHYLLNESPNTSALAFPVLTHLTIVPNDTCGTGSDAVASRIPALPFTHMPNLTHVVIPLAKNEATQLAFPVPDLSTLVTHAQRLSLLELAGVSSLPCSASPTSVAQRIAMNHLTRAAFRASHMKSLLSSFAMPNLQSLTLLVDTGLTNQKWVSAVADQGQSLTRLTFYMDADRFPETAPEWWHMIASGLPKLADLAFHAHGMHDLRFMDQAGEDPAVNLVDANEGMGDQLLDIEDLSPGAIAAEEEVWEMGVADGTAARRLTNRSRVPSDPDMGSTGSNTAVVNLPNLQRLSITHPRVSLGVRLSTPNLKSLAVHADCLDSFTSVLPQVDSLVLHGHLTTKVAQLVINLVTPQAHVEFVPPTKPAVATAHAANRPQNVLSFRFAGAQHARTWLKVLHTCQSLSSGGRLQGTRAATVVLTADVADKHAQLIAQVIEKLLGKDACQINVVWKGGDGGKGNEVVRRVNEAICWSRLDEQGSRDDCEE